MHRLQKEAELQKPNSEMECQPEVVSNVPVVAEVEPHAQRLCPICSDVAPEGDVHHPHYGGICCYSCRAFFRRAHQRGPGSKEYVCKREGKCVIYPKSKQLCKRCRLDKCLGVGMNPKWVLTPEEKKIRFKHYFKKKEDMAMGLHPEATTTTAMEAASIPGMKRSRKRPASTSASVSVSVSLAQDPEDPDESSSSQSSGPWVSPADKSLRASSAASAECVDSEGQNSTEMGELFKVLNPRALMEPRMPDLIEQSHPSPSSACRRWFSGSPPDTKRKSPCLGTHFSSLRMFDARSLDDRKPMAAGASPFSCSVGPRDVVAQPGKVSKVDLSHSYLNLFTQLSTVMDAFTIISSKVNPSSDVGKTIIMNHQRLKCLSKRTIISQMSAIATMVAEFAASLIQFSSLSVGDQNVLLQNNIPLYLQYVLARYFSSDSGLEQVNWILEGQISIIPIDHVILLKRISFTEYNDIAQFFTDPAVASAYSHCAEAIGMFFPYPQHCNSVIANLLLFNVDQSFEKDLSEPEKVRVIFKDAEEVVRVASMSMDSVKDSIASKSVGPLLTTLKKMNRMFGMCQVEETSGTLLPLEPSVKEIGFTTVEESWLKRKLFDFQDQFRSVGLPESYYNDMINMWAYDQNVSDTFVQTWICLSRERARRVLKIHPEFTRLPDRDQEFIWSKNNGPALALHCVRINMHKNGKDQLRSALGVMDSNTEWEGEFSEIMDLDKIKAHYLGDQTIHKGKLDDMGLNFLSTMMREVSEWCSKDELFQLFFLIVLLDVEGLERDPSYNGIIQMRRIYLKFFQRKLEAVGLPLVAYNRFRKILRKIKFFANLMEVFLD